MFYIGSIKRDDRDYLLSIRNGEADSPERMISTPDEVCKRMKSKDFSSYHILNVYLIDYLLEDDNQQDQCKRAGSELSRNEKAREQFFSAYYRLGKFPSLLLLKVEEI